MHQKQNLLVAIIGAGPRGLSALESLYTVLAAQSNPNEVKTLLFEETDQLGNGPVYDRNQPDSNWLNISDRGLTIPGRMPIEGKNFSVDGFPSYHEWSGFDAERDTGTTPDQFTTRSNLGRYLSQRFQSIAEKLMEHKLLNIINQKVVQLDYEERQFRIKTSISSYDVDEVALTIGHQPTVLDEQLTGWKEQVHKFGNLTLVTDPYPIGGWKAKINSNDTIGLRGFGLAMIDVARAVTDELGGSFELLDEHTRKMIYHAPEKTAVHLVPFSLNGLPMTPKPLNLELDKPFIPSDKELHEFENCLQKALRQDEKISNHTFLINTIAPLISVKFCAMEDRAYKHELTEKEIEVLATKWLDGSSAEDVLLLSKELPAYESMKAFVEMATGHHPVSLDYCIGQVWRHCQPSMYKALSFTNLEDEVVADIIQLDERLKRYSYGPPVDSMSQLLALVDARTLTLDFVKDPTITIHEKGWEFRKDDKKINSNVMIDTVLDSPKLLKVNSSLVNRLLTESLVAPVHGTLGIATDETSVVSLEKEDELIPLAVLGRLAKGTIIGVDAILQCFGERSELWAEGVVTRLHC